MSELLLARVETCYQQAERFFNRAFIRPHISFALRGQKAGCAHLQENKLRFNEPLYRENHDHFLLQTVAHEVAHLVAYQQFGGNIRPHGGEWQAIMRKVYGLEPKRCHQYKVAEKPRQGFIYRCDCAEEVIFSARRHALVQTGRRYRCLRCNRPLEFYAKQPH